MGQGRRRRVIARYKCSPYYTVTPTCLVVASQCISEAFGVDLQRADDEAAFSLKPAKLNTLIDVFLKTQKKQQQPQTDK